MKKKSTMSKIVIVLLIVCAVAILAIFAFSVLSQKKSLFDIFIDEEIQEESVQISKVSDDSVKDIIRCIEELPSPDEITINEKEQVMYVYQEYLTLLDEEKNLVTNRQKLLDSVKAISVITESMDAETRETGENEKTSLESIKAANEARKKAALVSGNGSGTSGNGMAGGIGGGGSGSGGGSGASVNRVSSFNDFADQLQTIMKKTDVNGITGSDFTVAKNDTNNSYDIYYQSTLMGEMSPTDDDGTGKTHGVSVKFSRTPNSHSLLLDLFSDMQYALTTAVSPDLTHEEVVNIVNKTVGNANAGGDVDPIDYEDVRYTTGFQNTDEDNGLLSYSCEYLDGRYFSLE